METNQDIDIFNHSYTSGNQEDNYDLIQIKNLRKNNYTKYTDKIENMNIKDQLSSIK